MPADPLNNESILLMRTAGGDEAAFRAIYDRYRKRIASFAYLLTESAEMADEIVQEVFIRLWIHRSKLADVENFNAWLHTVTRNLVADSMKKIAREQKVRTAWGENTPTENLQPDELIFARENERLLQKAIQTLTPQQQQVYRMSRELGLKHEEIAGQLNISTLTVKNHLVNAMRTIREYFRRHTGLIMLAAILHHGQ